MKLYSFLSFTPCSLWMDSYLASGAVGGGTIGTILGICYLIKKLVEAINHRECRSKCCGRDLGPTSLDVNVTPLATPVATASAVVLPNRSVVSTRVRPPLHPIRADHSQVLDAAMDKMSPRTKAKLNAALDALSGLERGENTHRRSPVHP